MYHNYRESKIGGGWIFSILLLSFGCASSRPAVENATEPSTSSTEVETSEKDGLKPVFTMPSVNADYYAESLSLLENGNTAAIETIDFVKFRFSYLEWKEKGIPEELTDRLSAALKRKDHSEQIAVADEILAYDFTDIKIHVIKSNALEASGQNAEFHIAMVKALVESILATGDGRSMQTAFHVAQVKEEYALIHIMGLQRHSQRLLSNSGRSFDLLQCVNGTGETVEIYFDITVHMARMMALLLQK